MTKEIRMTNVETGKPRLWAARLSSHFGIRASFVIWHSSFVILSHDPHSSRSRPRLEPANGLVELLGGLASGRGRLITPPRYSLRGREPAVHRRNVFKRRFRR